MNQQTEAAPFNTEAALVWIDIASKRADASENFEASPTEVMHLCESYVSARKDNLVLRTRLGYVDGILKAAVERLRKYEQAEQDRQALEAAAHDLDPGLATTPQPVANATQPSLDEAYRAAELSPSDGA